MAIPASIGVAAAALGDDVDKRLRRVAVLVAAVLVIPLLISAVSVGALMALIRGGVDAVPAGQAVAGGAAMRGGSPSAAALAEIPSDQLAIMQQVSAASTCSLPWPVLAATAKIASDFGRTADQFSSAGGGYGSLSEPIWNTYGGGVPWRSNDASERSQPISDRNDSSNYRLALPAMARYLCASGAGADMRGAISAYDAADGYVTEVLALATRYGTLAMGGGLVPGWWQMPALDQFDRRYYGSDQTWLTWRNSACSAAALTWLLRAYGVQVPSIDAAIDLIGPYTGIAPSLGLLDARGPALAKALGVRGLNARMPRDHEGRLSPLRSIGELQSWLDRGPLLMDGARWFGEGHWFVAISYDRDGVYIRDSSGYATQYLTWARLYGEVGFSGWVVGVA